MKRSSWHPHSGRESKETTGGYRRRPIATIDLRPIQLRLHHTNLLESVVKFHFNHRWPMLQKLCDVKFIAARFGLSSICLWCDLFNAGFAIVDLRVDFEDGFDFDGDAAGEGVGAEGAAGGDASVFAEDVAE